MGAHVRLGSRLVRALLVRDLRATPAWDRALGFRRTGCHPGEADAPLREPR